MLEAMTGDDYPAVRHWRRARSVACCRRRAGRWRPTTRRGPRTIGGARPQKIRAPFLPTRWPRRPPLVRRLRGAARVVVAIEIGE